MTTITQIAKQAKVSPKVARARVRRAKNAPKGASKTRWVFTGADVAKVRAIVKAA